jgi:energy-coupling factor transport system permease protein
MRLLEPLVVDPRAPLARVHPLAKIGGAVIIMLGLLITVDVVTSGIVLVAILIAIRLLGLSPRAVAVRATPLIFSAVALGVFSALVGTSGSAGGVAIAMRVIGISLSGIVAVAAVDPTELADAIVEHLHAPPRFVVGALAAFRLFPLFSRQWDTLGLARRARGIEADRTLWQRLAAFPDRAVGLLVSAIRRATRLALAMDARGFGSRACRTLARPHAFGIGDVGLLVATAAVVSAATATSIALGTWRPLLTF